MATLKERVARGDVTRGIWQNLPGPDAAEIAASAGFDWVLIDGEHGAFDPTALRLKLIAAPDAVVRVPGRESWMIAQVLDAGARTVLVPMVNDAADAEAVVAAAYYPPKGRRGVGAMIARAGGWGADPAYLDRAGDEVSIWVQAESRLALQNLEAICAVPGVSCVFLGPADLSRDMGARPSDPVVTEALADAIRRIDAAGCAPGIFGGADAAHWIETGARVVALGSDAMVLTAGLAALR